VLTMAAVAENKKIKLNKADVQIAHQINQGTPWRTSVSIRINLGEGLTGREQKILFNSARLCEVHKMLAGEFSFEYEFITE